MPINFTANNFPLERLEGIEEYLEGVGYEPTEHFSFSAMFRSAGATDLPRKWMRIRSRQHGVRRMRSSLVCAR